MKRKILPTILLIVMLLNISSQVLAYSRTGGSNLEEIAIDISDDTYVDGNYSAKSNTVTSEGVTIYKYKTNENLEYTDITYQITDNYYKGHEIALTANNTLEGVATVEYKNGLTYDGRTYDVKIDIDKITTTSVNSDTTFRIQTAKGGTQTSDPFTTEFLPQIGVNNPATGASGEPTVTVDATYYVVDSNGNNINISGVFRVHDIDLNQGVYIKDFTAENNSNVFMNKTDIDSTYAGMIKYSTDSNGTYIYSETDDNRQDSCHAYLLLSNKDKVELSLTFDGKNAYSNLSFVDDVVKPYRKITTEVVNGTIDNGVNNLKTGDSPVTINYSPNTGYVLDYIEVDGTRIEVTSDNINKYVFNDFSKNHHIKVVYKNAPITVTFDTKGGTTVDSQTIEVNEKATRPTNDPTKPGNTFDDWYTDENYTTKFDYDTPLTEDTTIYAKWNPIKYRITYVLNDTETEPGTNDPSNPSEYSTGDEFTLKNPTRNGYTFEGWYENEDLSGDPAGTISNRTGDLTFYAKWKKIEPVAYKVEHYLETEEGKYELNADSTENLSDVPGAVVTATPKTFDGYTEDTNNENRVVTGTVTEDGSLVLKLYYNKNKYTVTFDTDGGSKNPDDQKVYYNDKATKPTDPTKTGYKFQYWYYKGDDEKTYTYNFDDPVTHDVDLIAKWEPEASNQITPKTDPEDNTTSQKSLANTGISTNIIIFIAIVSTAVVGIRYFKLRNMMK